MGREIRIVDPKNRKGNGVGDEKEQMKTKKFSYRHVYGPVPSKRLGRSLGVDLAPFKRCTYDCIYCQLGRTTDKTVEPKTYATSDAICSELERKLSFGPPPDYISLAGSGEPTLNAGIGELIARIKGMTNIPVAVLTNGSLLWRDGVRTALMATDLVLPSLDAGDEAMFQYINRPHPDISFERMITGLSDFVRLYQGPVWLEVFLLAGVTAIPGEIGKIDALLRKMRPARVQLNTVTRPPAEEFAFAVSEEQMEGLKGLFSHTVEIVGRHAPAESPDLQTGQSMADIISLLKRRPCTLDGVSSGLAMQPGETLKHLDTLCRKGSVTVVHMQDSIFYRVI
jgi:wyosine [tRNA(Phe)-imidazoG37] synthetase (radical SAM superfamily)